MQVLTSGSFINLENQEKIERLIFTAKEIAVAASGAYGFNNEEESNRKFADEIWQSAEYMSREHEEARIKAVFTGAFLERLRELRGGAAATQSPVEISENISQEIVAESVAETEFPKAETESPKDEFLGIVSTDINGETGELHEQSSIQTDAPQTLAIEKEVFRQANEFGENQVAEEEDLRFALAEQPASSQPIHFEVIVEAENEKVEAETETTDESHQEETDAGDESIPKTVASNSLRLPDKEPYQFDKCTVTATIQLFPASENSANRKAVLSVRTHDFAPQISMIELSGSDLPAALMPELQKVLSRYQSDLPAKVMDKLKKEKNAPKKQVKPAATETKSVAPAALPPTTKENTAKVSPTETEQIPQKEVAVNPPAQPAASQQGSLFG